MRRPGARARSDRGGRPSCAQGYVRPGREPPRAGACALDRYRYIGIRSFRKQRRRLSMHHEKHEKDVMFFRHGPGWPRRTGAGRPLGRRPRRLLHDAAARTARLPFVGRPRATARPADPARRCPRGDPAARRGGAAQRLPDHAGARIALRRRLAPEPRLGLPRAPAARRRRPASERGSRRRQRLRADRRRQGARRREPRAPRLPLGAGRRGHARGHARARRAAGAGRDRREAGHARRQRSRRSRPPRRSSPRRAGRSTASWPTTRHRPRRPSSRAPPHPAGGDPSLAGSRGAISILAPDGCRPREAARGLGRTAASRAPAPRLLVPLGGAAHGGARRADGRRRRRLAGLRDPPLGVRPGPDRARGVRAAAAAHAPRGPPRRPLLAPAALRRSDGDHDSGRAAPARRLPERRRRALALPRPRGRGGIGQRDRHACRGARCRRWSCRSS